MIPGNASAALIPNRPDSDASALSLFLIHSFKPLSSLGGGSKLPDATASPPPDTNAFNKYPDGHPNSREYGSNHNSLLSKQSSDLFSQRDVFIQHFGNCFFKARNLILQSTLQKIDRLLSNLQILIQIIGSLGDVFFHCIIVNSGIVSEFLELVMLFSDVLFQLKLFCYLNF